MQLATDPGGRARPSARRTPQNAEQRAGRQGRAEREPRFEVRPAPAVHPDLAALVPLPVPDENGAAVGVQISLVERERFADPQPGPPQHHDHTAQSQPIGVDLRQHASRR